MYLILPLVRTSRTAYFLALFVSSFFIAAPVTAADATDSSYPIVVACVGDSITHGAGAPKGLSYPNQLQTILGSGWKINNFGVSGATLLRNGDKPYWKQAALQKALASKPNVVVLMLGTNDSKPQNWVHESEFLTDCRDLIKAFQSLDTKPRLYLCHPPTVVEPNKYRISESVSAVIRQRIDAVAKEMGIEVIPMDQAYGSDLSVLKDNVHPDERGAKELAETVAKALTASPGTLNPAPSTK
jgi:acyl-CoA thioesterase-1